MTILDFLKLAGAASVAVSLIACHTTPPPRPSSPPSPQVSVPPPASRAETIEETQVPQYATVVERTFAEGLDLYSQGEYDAAIKKFQSPELSKAWPELRVRTLKYLAFSYCVTDRIKDCQKAFYDAFQIDPKFKLKPSEERHPIWGPVFQKIQSDLFDKSLPIQSVNKQKTTK